MNNVIQFPRAKKQFQAAAQYEDPAIEAIIDDLNRSQRLQDETIGEMVARIMRKD